MHTRYGPVKTVDVTWIWVARSTSRMAQNAAREMGGASRLLNLGVDARPALRVPIPQISRNQTLRNSTLVGVGGSCSGLNPVGTPFESGRYSPPSARTRISSPRSLSKMTCVTPCLSNIATRNPMNTVLPDPVGPQMNVCPVSFGPVPSRSAGSLACKEK